MDTMTITEMLQTVPDIAVDLIQIGYEQADCNDEKMVDFGDAIRILIEDNFICNFTKESLELFSVIIEIKCKKIWNNEFPDDVARM